MGTKVIWASSAETRCLGMRTKRQRGCATAGLSTTTLLLTD
ncbi:unnamed protein product [Periconia digitata]|uniref:Uncharacterized protein n=1 Tax=Periconia digitata TaxID=1303443 RepID=A0A9W4XMW9_9PLEO|nr:unnamed protein product [Periconia digitata]